MRKRAKRRAKRIAFIQPWGSYENETLVIVGATKDEIVSFMKRIRVKDEFVEKFRDNGPEDKTLLTSSGFVWSPRDSGVTLLYFRDWRNDWDHWDTLVHETNHLIFRILVENKGMGIETEAMAYQQEYLFRNIRRKLWMLSARSPKTRNHFKKLLGYSGDPS